MTEPVPVVVIGAGPTGVTVATLLAQYGIASVVLDRWSGVYPQPRAVHLDDEVYRILDRLGVAGEFAAISRPAKGLQLRDRHLNVLAELRRGPTGPHGHPQANMFDQPELEELLRANLKHYPITHIRGNTEVTAITEQPGGLILVSFVDRTDAGRHSLTARYVLGCDGANSLTRNHIGATMTELRFEQRWLVVDVATAADLHQWEGVHQICDSTRAATYMRIGRTRYRWEFQLLAGETAEDYRTLPALRTLIDPWTAGVPDDDLSIGRVAEYTFRAQIADRWRRGNVFLLGDAAHLTPPFIGQGMGAGLRDAMNLAWKLAGVCHHDLPETVLDTYEQERKPHARNMIGMALAIGRAMTSGARAGDLLRRLLVPRLHLVPGLRSRVVDSRTPALHRCALVRRGPLPGQLAGTLCPSAEMPGGRRLDESLGAGFTLLTVEQPTELQNRIAAQRGAAIVRAVPGSDLATWLRRGHVRGAILRPDHTVYAARRDIAGLYRELPCYRGTAAAAVRLRDSG